MTAHKEPERLVRYTFTVTLRPSATQERLEVLLADLATKLSGRLGLVELERGNAGLTSTGHRTIVR